MPRPRFGAEVAPNAPPLPPAPVEPSTLEFNSLRLGGKTGGATVVVVGFGAEAVGSLASAAVNEEPAAPEPLNCAQA